jgi:hypothetical protein
MPANIQPIFTRLSDIQGGVLLIGAAADTIGTNANNSVVATADPTNGSYFQKLRFKVTGTVVATVARIYINNGYGVAAPTSNTVQNLTGTPSGTGGSLLTQNLVAKVCSVDQWGVPSPFSTVTANVAVNSPTGIGSVVWNWNAASNSNTYILITGFAAGSEGSYVKVVGANTYTQTTTMNDKVTKEYGVNQAMTQLYNNFYIGDLSLPAVTGTLTTAMPEVDYPLNIALPANTRILVGLGTTTNVSNGWVVTAIGGKY